MVSTPEKKPVDWEGIERDYRAGILSVREIASAHGVSHTAVNKRARTQNWARDLKARIQAKADDLVSRAAVSTQVSSASPETRASDQAVIDANAEAILQVRLTHRKHIADSRELTLELLNELRHQTHNRELYDQLFELVNADAAEDVSDAGRDRLARLRQAFDRALSLGGRTKTMKDLADTLKTLIALEREAFGMTVVGTTPNSYEQNLKDLAG